MNRERVIKAMENCTAESKCKNCPWTECEYEHKTIEMPLGLTLDALELLKEQEPRMLTQEEAKSLQHDTVVWYEHKSQHDSIPRIIDRTSGYGIRFTDGAIRCFGIDVYGKRWRLWSARPTDEQREAVPWDE